MLKNIIVPVDFSDQAENALLFAAEIAKRVSSTLTILHSNLNSENPVQDRQKLDYHEANLTNTFGSELQI